MWRNRVVILMILALLISASIAYAQSGNGYDLSWGTIDGGGHASSTGSSYELGGTIGQSDAGVLSSGGYTLSGGFWGSVAASGASRVYLPLVLRLG
jgi:hypothetical protein